MSSSVMSVVVNTNMVTRKCQGRRTRARCHIKKRPYSQAADPIIIQLRQWMANTANFSCSLVPALFPGTGRGLMTKKRISAGETIVRLPGCLLITTHTVLASDIGDHIKKWEVGLTAQHAISLWLVWQKQLGHQSTWQPYIASLPAAFSTPVYWSRRQLEALPAHARLKAQHDIDHIQHLYSITVTVVKQRWTEMYEVLTFDEFKWAWSVINTRSVYMEIEDCEYISTEEPNNIALAPFLDLLNHSSSANITASYNPRCKCYEIVTHDNYRPYEQVFISYGCHGTEKLILEYGFCVPDNPQDTIYISYELLMNVCRGKKLAHMDRKLALLRQHDLLSNLTCSREGVSWKLWTVLKTLVMDWQQLQQWSGVFREEGNVDSVSEPCRALASDLLHEYSTQLGPNLRLAQQMRQTDDDSPGLQLILALLKTEAEIIQTATP